MACSEKKKHPPLPGVACAARRIAIKEGRPTPRRNKDFPANCVVRHHLDLKNRQCTRAAQVLKEKE